MIYWKYYNSYKIIRDESLEDMAKRKGINMLPTTLDEEANEWFNFAHIIANEHDFNIVYETCFEYYVTLYFADEGISAGAEDEYFMKKLNKKIASIYDEARSIRDSEKEQKIQFFNDLLKFFEGDEIKQYEKRIFQHNLQVDNKVKEWFLQFDTIRDGILKLLNKEVEPPHLNVYTINETYIAFMLTYSEETKWRSLSSFADKDRLNALLC